jgi:hypothetical protein
VGKWIALELSPGLEFVEGVKDQLHIQQWVGVSTLTLFKAKANVRVEWVYYRAEILDLDSSHFRVGLSDLLILHLLRCTPMSKPHAMHTPHTYPSQLAPNNIDRSRSNAVS